MVGTNPYLVVVLRCLSGSPGLWTISSVPDGPFPHSLMFIPRRWETNESYDDDCNNGFYDDL